MSEVVSRYLALGTVPFVRLLNLHSPSAYFHPQSIARASKRYLVESFKKVSLGVKISDENAGWLTRTELTKRAYSSAALSREA